MKKLLLKALVVYGASGAAMITIITWYMIQYNRASWRQVDRELKSMSEYMKRTIH